MRRALVLLLALGGCYTTGLRFPTSCRRIAVPVFGNETYQRGYEFALTDQVRQLLLEQSDVQLVGNTELADAVIRGRILTVSFPVLVGGSRQGILEGSTAVSVEAELVDRRSGSVLARVGGTDIAEFTAALGQSRDTAAAEVLNELAWKILLGLSERSRQDLPLDRESSKPRR